MNNVVPAPIILTAHDGVIFIVDYCLSTDGDTAIRTIMRFFPGRTSGERVKLTDVPDYLRLTYWQSLNFHDRL